CREAQEFLILGFIESTAARRTLGALLLGYHAGEELVYAGKVGTGWSAAQALELYTMLGKLKGPKPELRKPSAADAGKGVVWIAPRLVCMVEYHDWTRDGIIMQASFKGMREDKPAEEVTLEAPARPGREPGRPGRDGSKPRAEARITLTHPDRMLWPEP